MAFTLEQIQKQANLSVADQQAQAGTKVADTSGFTPITSASLAPTTPIQIPTTPPPSTASAGIIASANQSVADTNAQALANVKANEQAAGVGQSQSKIEEMLLGVKDLFSRKATATQDVYANSPEAQQKAVEMKTLNDLNTEVADVTVKLRGEQDAIKGRGDITKEAQAGLLGNLNDTYGRRLADLAIRQSAASGNITRLESSLKDALALKLAPIEADLTYYKDFGLKNQQNLTDQEKDRLNAIVAEKTRLQSQVTAEQTVASNAIKEALAVGVKIPDSVVKQIQANPGQAYAILASNGISLLKPTIKTGSTDPSTGLDQYTNDLDAIIGSVLSTIPTKFGQQTFNAQIAKARNDTDKLNLVASQVLKGQSAELKSDFANQATGISQIDKAIKLLDEGVKTGLINNTAQYVYNLAGKDFDPKLAEINGLLVSAIQPYRNSVTGAAWGNQEDGEYQQLFGSTKYSPTELRQRLLQTKELLKAKSSEGLNAFVNPLGVYDNQFQVGTLTPGSGSATGTNNSSTDPLGIL